LVGRFDFRAKIVSLRGIQNGVCEITQKELIDRDVERRAIGSERRGAGAKLVGGRSRSGRLRLAFDDGVTVPELYRSRALRNLSI
jgi:hypothetical protein